MNSRYVEALKTWVVLQIIAIALHALIMNKIPMPPSLAVILVLLWFAPIFIVLHQLFPQYAGKYFIYPVLVLFVISTGIIWMKDISTELKAKTIDPRFELAAEESIAGMYLYMTTLVAPNMIQTRDAIFEAHMKAEEIYAGQVKQKVENNTGQLAGKISSDEYNQKMAMLNLRHSPNAKDKLSDEQYNQAVMELNAQYTGTISSDQYVQNTRQVIQDFRKMEDLHNEVMMAVRGHKGPFGIPYFIWLIAVVAVTYLSYQTFGGNTPMGLALVIAGGLLSALYLMSTFYELQYWVSMYSWMAIAAGVAIVIAVVLSIQQKSMKPLVIVAIAAGLIMLFSKAGSGSLSLPSFSLGSIQTMPFKVETVSDKEWLVTLPANMKWATTGIQINNGDNFVVSHVSGQWRWDETDSHRTNGSAWGRWSGLMVPSAGLAQLVWKVGGRMAYVPFGQTITAQSQGELELSINDKEDSFFDNQGSLVLRVKKL